MTEKGFYYGLLIEVPEGERKGPVHLRGPFHTKQEAEEHFVQGGHRWDERKCLPFYSVSREEALREADRQLLSKNNIS